MDSITTTTVRPTLHTRPPGKASKCKTLMEILCLQSHQHWQQLLGVGIKVETNVAFKSGKELPEVP